MIACPTCGSPTRVLATRGARRIRTCLKLSCGGRVTTVEVVIPSGRQLGDVVAVPKRLLEQVRKIFVTIGDAT